MDQNWEWDEFLEDRSVQARKDSAAAGIKKEATGTRNAAGARPSSGAKQAAAGKTAGVKKPVGGTKSAAAAKSNGGTKSASGAKKPSAGRPASPGTKRPADAGTKRPADAAVTRSGGTHKSGSVTRSSAAPARTRTHTPPEGFSNVTSHKKKKKKKKSKAFWIGYGILVAVLLIALIVIVRSVRRTMEDYRDNVPETVIRAHLADLSEADIQSMFVSNPVYETPEEAAANIRAFLADGSDLVIRRADYADRGSEKAYSVHKDGRKLFTTYLKSLEQKSWMDLLSYDILEFAGYEAEPDVEFFRYEIKAPSVFEVTVNGRPLQDPVSTESFQGFADGAEHVAVPAMNTYVVDHLTKEATIVASENGVQFPVTVQEKIDLTETYEASHTFASTEEAGIDFDAIGFAKQWSMFLRDDLGGNLHGYYQLEPYFIPGTSMEQKAKQWGSSIDITFTSAHTLNNPPFTNEEVTRVVKFDENTAAVDVYLEMHMTLTKTGEARTDVFDSTIYLVRTGDGAWKVANIRGNTEEENF